ncbi:hypothetical protein [Paenibacillus sp. FSL K6-2859]|uniref:hypothetical protein n=1 Tax=Paenibacillus sp. FSL K6-2859 TaxID=2921482 RepID=UPI0030FACDFC
MESRMHRKVPVRFGWGEKPEIISKVYLSTLLRQPFISSDIGLKKADVLSKRYGSTYGLKIGSYTNSYIESVESLEKLFTLTDYRHEYNQHIQKVLIGAVDNVRP